MPPIAGWFYIPGTETCIRFSGLVYAYYGANNFHDEDGEISDHTSGFRGRLNIQANNETEYGTLSSRIRIQGTGGARTAHDDLLSGPYVGDPGVVLDKAHFSLAGFTNK